MQRIFVLGRGGAGKSTLARRLGSLTGFPVIELDKWFWQPGLVPTPRDRWVDIQRALIQPEMWIIDGDVGPHDVLEPLSRLRIPSSSSTSRCCAARGGRSGAQARASISGAG